MKVSNLMTDRISPDSCLWRLNWCWSFPLSNEMRYFRKEDKEEIS